MVDSLDRTTLVAKQTLEAVNLRLVFLIQLTHIRFGCKGEEQDSGISGNMLNLYH